MYVGKEKVNGPYTSCDLVSPVPEIVNYKLSSCMWKEGESQSLLSNVLESNILRRKINFKKSYTVKSEIKYYKFSS